MTRRAPRRKAAITGADLKNPSRYRRNVPTLCPIGKPSTWLNEAQREAWEQFCAELPWLSASHRAILELACVLRAQITAGGELGVNRLQVLSAVLSKLGATPVDEGRAGWADDADEDPMFDA